MPDSEKDQTCTWEIRFSLMTNPNIVKAWVKAMGVTYLLCIAILIPIFAGTGEWEAIPVMLGIFLVVCTGLMLSGFVIMLIVMGNTSRARFSVSQEGVSYESMDRTARTMSRIAVLAGGFFGSPVTSGAGLLSIAGETVVLPWSVVRTAIYDEKNNTIRLRNEYRDLLHLYCSHDNFDPVRQIVQRNLVAGETIEPDRSRGHQFRRGIVITLAVLAASLPLYALNDILDLHIMLSLLIMLFSLATVWLVPLFGWVVLVMETGATVWIISQLMKSSTLKLVNTYQFKGYELLDAGEWMILFLGFSGIAFLAWISIRAVKGKWVPVLMQDQLEN